MFPRDSVGAAVVVVLMFTLGCGAGTWYRGRLYPQLRMRFWHGALIGLVLGVALVVSDAWP